MVSFMVLLIPADINAWLGHKQESKLRSTCNSSTTLFTSHMVDPVVVLLIPESSGHHKKTKNFPDNYVIFISVHDCKSWAGIKCVFLNW